MHKTYTINGMTCEHCVKAITEEVSALDGVDNVTVSLESGSMTIDSAEEIPFGKVADAVDEAGEYTVAEASSLDAVRPRPPTLTFPTTHRPPGSLGLPVREPVTPDIPDSRGSSTKETHVYPDSPRRAV